MTDSYIDMDARLAGEIKSIHQSLDDTEEMLRYLLAHQLLRDKKVQTWREAVAASRDLDTFKSLYPPGTFD